MNAKNRIEQPGNTFQTEVPLSPESAATTENITEPLAHEMYEAEAFPEWERMVRFPQISGRYEGTMTYPSAKSKALDLRIDIDSRHPESPVMNRVSGDFYKIFEIHLPGKKTIRWSVYQSSWIVDKPVVSYFSKHIEISGDVRYWKGIPRVNTTMQISIPRTTIWKTGSATVNFSKIRGIVETYSCSRKSNCFRQVTLEVDVCNSVNIPPLLPAYNTHWHNIRPADISNRMLTIEECYHEAGIQMTINPDHTIIDDSDTKFKSWSADELHDAMELYFSQYPGTWPKWHLWGLLAGSFDYSGVGGIMFDAAAIYGGAGHPPDRQGFAVFRNHSWFNNLVAGVPANQAQAYSMRHYLYTWVHEAGHAFNLLHSWDKSRPDSLSWMNYDWKYDMRNGEDSFWSNFNFQFDDEELIHMRHGDRASVIMGGDPWASGTHMESAAEENIMAEGDVPIELLVRSKEYFEFMEPVSIELRLRNLLTDLPLTLDTHLNPEFGGVMVVIRRPDGRTLLYKPIMCKLGDPELKTLQPKGHPVSGSDRYSEFISLTYGTYGFYFDQPGEYMVRAIYQGSGDVLVTSNVHRLRIGTPLSKEDDRMAQDMFTYEVGMNIYLNGSRSPFLQKGMDKLQSVYERSKDSALGAKIAGMIARSLSRPFYRISDIEKPVLKKAYDADPERAISMTQSALSFYQTHSEKENNIAYEDLVKTRANLFKAMGNKEAANKDVSNLMKDLSKRSVNQSVLDQIKAYQESL